MKQTIQLGVLSAANIGIGFLFQWFVFIKLGPGIETDALFAGMTLPQLVLVVISGSLMHVLVPLLAGEEEDRLRHDAWGFLILIGGLFTLLSMLLYITAPWWVPIIVPGFNNAALALTIELTRIQLIGMVFTAINGVQWAAYHARQQFMWTEFSPILASIVALLLLIWALPHFGVLAAAWIGTFRMVLQTVLLAPGMGSPIRPDLKSIFLRQAWQRIRPLLLGTAYYKTDPVIDRYLLSNTGSGSLSLYYLAQQIYGAVGQIINKAIAAPLVPQLSKLNKIGNMNGFQKIYYKILLQVSIISIACSFIFYFFGQAMLDLLVGYGNVNSDNVTDLWRLMILLAGVFVGGVLGQISSSALYALGDTSTPTNIGIYSYSFYIPVKLISFYFFGISGLAIATSAFLIFNFFLQSYFLRKKYFLI